MYLSQEINFWPGMEHQEVVSDPVFISCSQIYPYNKQPMLFSRQWGSGKSLEDCAKGNVDLYTLH